MNYLRTFIIDQLSEIHQLPLSEVDDLKRELSRLLNREAKPVTNGRWDYVDYAVGFDSTVDPFFATLSLESLNTHNELTGHCTCASFSEPRLCSHLLRLLSHLVDLEQCFEGGSSLFETRFTFEHQSLLSPEIRAVFTNSPETDSWTWDQCFRLMGKKSPAKIAGPSWTNQAIRLWYEIDRVKSELTENLIIKTFYSETLSDGKQSAIRPFYFNPLNKYALPREEHMALQLMEAVAISDNDEKRQIYVIPHPFQARVLEILSNTGRLFTTQTESLSKENLKTLVWDPTPYKITLIIQKLHTSAMVSCQLKGNGNNLTRSQLDFILQDGFALADATLIRISNQYALRWLQNVNSDYPLIIAENEIETFFQELSKNRTLPCLEIAPEFGIESFQPDPSPLIQFLTSKEAGNNRLVRVFFRYSDFFKVTPDDPMDSWLDPVNQRVLIRNRALEQERLEELPFDFLKPAPDMFSSPMLIKEKHIFLTVQELIKKGWQIEIQGKPIRKGSMGTFRVHSGIDWFDLSLDIDFEGQKISFAEILKQIKKQSEFVKLADGSRGLIDPQWAEKLSTFLSFSNQEDLEHLRFHSSQALILERLLQDLPQVDLDKKFLNFKKQIARLDEPTPVEEPQGFKGTLRPYQKEGLGWIHFLQKLNVNGCLADDMGLGKTVQVLALLQGRKSTLPSLVVVPKSLVQNWAREASHFTPDLKVICYEGLHRKQLFPKLKNHQVVILTYGILRRDIMALKDLKWDYVILDESQAIKNRLAQSTKAARLLQANYKLALTGTPIENHVDELWSQFEFLNPGILGHSSLFKILSGKKSSLSKEDHAVIARGLRPFILRRTKSQVLSDLPLKTEQTLICKMEKDQEKVYQQLRKSIQTDLRSRIEEKGISGSGIYILEALLRLRQAACHPALLGYEDKTSIKFHVLLEHLDEIIAEGHKALVFSQFTQLLGLLKREIFNRGWAFEYLDGKSRRRAESIRRFQEEKDVPLFLISLKAGGLGLNLTAADYVYILDPWWNPAVENQAIDRAHRIGQTKSVFAYRILVQNTVEEKITALQKRKKELAEAIVSENNSLIGNLTPEDLEILFS